MIVTDISSDRSIALEFVYVQGTPATIWEIEHNMNCHPGVTVIDSGKNQVEGSVTYDSLNKVTISFTSGFSGMAIIAGGNLIYQGSDELDYYIDSYSKPEFKWRSDAEENATEFLANALKMKQSHAFANRYIKGLDGDDNPFEKIYKLLSAPKK